MFREKNFFARRFMCKWKLYIAFMKTKENGGKQINVIYKIKINLRIRNMAYVSLEKLVFIMF